MGWPRVRLIMSNIKADSLITVVGSGAVTLIDGSEMNYTDVADVENKGPVAVSNLKIHILTDGCRYHKAVMYISPAEQH
jgi:cyanophycinase-like exopeptidase